MDYLKLVFDLPAIVAGATILAYSLPVKLPPRCAPLLLFLTGILIWFLPAFIVFPLALTLPAAYLMKLLGIDMHSHDAADYSKAVELTKTGARKARDRIKPPVTQEYVTHGYPQVDAPVVDEDIPPENPGEHEDPEPPLKLEAGATVTDTPKFVPRL